MTDLVNPRHAICRVREDLLPLEAGKRAARDGTMVGFLENGGALVVWDDGEMMRMGAYEVTVIPQPADEKEEKVLLCDPCALALGHASALQNPSRQRGKCQECGQLQSLSYVTMKEAPDEQAS